MTTEELDDLMEYHNDEIIKFDRVKEPLSKRPDLHAFLVLDKLVPGNRDIVSGATHDEIWLGVEPSELAAVVDEATLIDLIRCGVRYDSSVDSLAMFT